MTAAEPNPNLDVSAVLAELEQAEAAEAHALADAERAQARVARLRGQESDVPGADPEDSGEAPAGRRRVGVRWPVLAKVAAVVVIAGLLTALGLMLGRTRAVAAQQNRDAQYVSAARDGVLAMLTVDYRHAKADVDRVLDLSTGTFRDNFAKGAADFIKSAESSKAVTQGTVTATALDSVEGGVGIVMVTVTSRVAESSAGPQDPRPLRMSVTVSEDGGRLKMSNVEFVP